MRYFCYISRGKVDQLYQQIDPEADYEVSESRTTEVDNTADWKIGEIAKLFSLGRSYGSKSVIQRDAKLKKTYLQKLERVISALASVQPIRPVKDLDSWEPIVSQYYHCSSLFNVCEPLSTNPLADDVISISTSIGDRVLVLDCTLSNFSEGPRPDGTFATHSGNSRFFRKRLALQLTAVFILLQTTDREIYGSPLFLQLSPPISNGVLL